MNHASPSLDSGHADKIHVADNINGDQTPELTVNGSVNGISNAPNGTHGLSDANSPATESPNTPVSNFAPDVKIDIDYPEQESDARNEPMPIKHIEPVTKSDNTSTVPQVGTPVDPCTRMSPSIPINPPHGTPPPPPGELLKDVQMAELNQQHDVSMEDGRAQSSATTPEVPPESLVPSAEGSQHDASMSNHPSPVVNTNIDDGDIKPPPSKRARVHSDADIASLAHSATPPPASVVSNAGSPPPFPPHSPPTSTLTSAQFRFCQSTVRSLRKLKDASPFLRPVDPIALNIPHYPQIIKNPMDFSTIERKLGSSNPAKPDPNMLNPRYYNAEEFISDVRLIFSNCLTFNGPDHIISVMGKRVEEVFDKQIKQMPQVVEPKPVVKKVVSPPPPPPPPAAPVKKAPARRASTSVPVIRRSEQETVGRPKREIHPPPPKDLPYADAPRKQRKAKNVKDDGTAEQLKFCSKILNEIHRKQHYTVASPFYEPVDWVKLDLPSYPKIVKKPMDLSTMRKKLDNNEYSNAQKFFDDFKLMIRNCFQFNPPGTPVNQAGVELQKIFDDKWKNLPLPHDASEEEDDDDDGDQDATRMRAIRDMEHQIESMREHIAKLKGDKPVKEKKTKKEKSQVASTSKSSSKTAKATSSKKKAKKAVAEDDVLTFEQKKDLSEAIGKLDGSKLEKVINIIHEGVPEIKDSNEEIELEIDLLPASVLTKLYNFVIRPMRAPPTKRSRAKGTGTGGLKRKSMDEDAEAEKIRRLEQRMALFDQGISTQASRRDVESEHSSDSSSDSDDSSGSDSE
ncbi:hypothetical protein AMATHDRAFT_47670 [Amanita thiersii Skay4041]|uniref:Bromodomain-containing protein n=1 Tax=Amanita thiersii Skay4041 TaxID=703135 RepID=A0A2A9NR03_9AGAR|nr:hypothetical protein AMATHDRAFT_47670 [Amanita thiersii Skay4041]